MCIDFFNYWFNKMDDLEQMHGQFSKEILSKSFSKEFYLRVTHFLKYKGLIDTFISFARGFSKHNVMEGVN